MLAITVLLPFLIFGSTCGGVTSSSANAEDIKSNMAASIAQAEAENCYNGARDGVEWKVFGEADEKVVAKTVVFGETDRRRRRGHGPIIAGNGRTSTGCSAECDQRPAAADQCSMTASTSGGASTQRMRGSRRNQRSWRRAN